MTETPAPYRRLAGRGAGLSSYFQLYLGGDHLLLVSSTGYSESYKRFFFRDIQAIVLQRTKLWLVLNLVFGFLTACCAVGWVMEAGSGFKSETGLQVAAGIFTGVCLVPFLINLLLGPSCSCQVQTAVQTERLPTVRRLRAARKVFQTILPLIEDAQGALSRADLEPAPDDFPSEPILAPPVVEEPPPPAPPAA